MLAESRERARRVRVERLRALVRRDLDCFREEAPGRRAVGGNGERQLAAQPPNCLLYTSDAADE